MWRAKTNQIPKRNQDNAHSILASTCKRKPAPSSRRRAKAARRTVQATYLEALQQRLVLPRLLDEAVNVARRTAGLARLLLWEGVRIMRSAVVRRRGERVSLVLVLSSLLLSSFFCLCVYGKDSRSDSLPKLIVEGLCFSE